MLPSLSLSTSPPTAATVSACSSPSLCAALVSAGALSVLSSALLHDNADIGNAAVTVCGELLDDNTLRELDSDAVQRTMQQLVRQPVLPHTRRSSPHYSTACHAW